MKQGKRLKRERELGWKECVLHIIEMAQRTSSRVDKDTSYKNKIRGWTIKIQTISRIITKKTKNTRKKNTRKRTFRW